MRRKCGDLFNVHVQPRMGKIPGRGRRAVNRAAQRPRPAQLLGAGGDGNHWQHPREETG